MRKYCHHNRPKQLSSGHNFIHGSISKVQSGLVTPLKDMIKRLSNGSYIPDVGFSPSDDSLAYQKLSFTEKMRKYEELSNWYNANKEVCEQVKNGDYSHFEPKAAPGPIEEPTT